MGKSKYLDTVKNAYNLLLNWKYISNNIVKLLEPSQEGIAFDCLTENINKINNNRSKTTGNRGNNTSDGKIM